MTALETLSNGAELLAQRIHRSGAQVGLNAEARTPQSYIADHRPEGWRTYHFDDSVECFREGQLYDTRAKARAAIARARDAQLLAPQT